MDSLGRVSKSKYWQLGKVGLFISAVEVAPLLLHCFIVACQLRAASDS